MERLGQYLADAPLTITPNMDGNDWTSFLKDNECIQDHPSILKHYTDTSLIQQFKQLAVKITDIFERPKSVLAVRFKLVHVLNCFNFGPADLRVSVTNLSREILLFTFLKKPSEHIHLLQVLLDNDLRYDIIPMFNYIN